MPQLGYADQSLGRNSVLAGAWVAALDGRLGIQGLYARTERVTLGADIESGSNGLRAELSFAPIARAPDICVRVGSVYDTWGEAEGEPFATTEWFAGPSFGRRSGDLPVVLGLFATPQVRHIRREIPGPEDTNLRIGIGVGASLEAGRFFSRAEVTELDGSNNGRWQVMLGAWFR